MPDALHVSTLLPASEHKGLGVNEGRGEAGKQWQTWWMWRLSWFPYAAIVVVVVVVVIVGVASDEMIAKATSMRIELHSSSS